MRENGCVQRRCATAVLQLDGGEPGRARVLAPRGEYPPGRGPTAAERDLPVSCHATGRAAEQPRPLPSDEEPSAPRLSLEADEYDTVEQSRVVVDDDEYDR